MSLEGGPISRRRALVTLAAGAVIGCGNRAAPAPAPALACVPEGAPDTSYCLVRKMTVRSPGARKLAVGQAQLTNIDDNTAVIVARDEGGYHALSGICTHQCCLVSLCTSTDCPEPTTNPGDCATSEVVASDPNTQDVLCTCHGSRFRLKDGLCLRPPQNSPLPKSLPSFALKFDGDDALVDTAQTVDAHKRV